MGRQGRLGFKIGLIVVAALILIGTAAVAVWWWLLRPPSTVPLPITQARAIALTGDSSRFDYESLDPGRGLLFIAHMGAGQVIEVDVRNGRVVRTINGLDNVHGVLVVPELQRVYATAAGTNQLVVLDETTGTELGRAPTGEYPDGLAYDPIEHTIWTTNEDGGNETVIDAGDLTVRGTVGLGDSVGNVLYDPIARRLMVDVQSDNTLAVIDPRTLAVVRRASLTGCDHDHGLNLDATHRLAFIACDGNSRLLTLDLRTWTVTGNAQTGRDPDVLSYDAQAGRLWVAAESGWLTILEREGRSMRVIGRGHLVDGAHVVVVDPRDHHAYLPVPHGPRGQPALLDETPTQ